MTVDEKTKIEIIRESVRRLEAEDRYDQDKGMKRNGPTIYDKCLEIVGNADLRNAQNLHFESAIRDFLCGWGSMGRVLGQKDYIGWERALVEQIVINRRELEEFRKKDLLCEDLDEHEATITKLYDSFRARVKSPIAAVKTLHLVCPNFFPLWDNSIANGVRAEHKDEKEKAFTAKDYYRFMKDLQTFGRKYEGILSELSLKYDKTRMKVLDEFLLWTVRHPFSFFLVRD
jgi:hypothetical protein